MGGPQDNQQSKTHEPEKHHYRAEHWI